MESRVQLLYSSLRPVPFSGALLSSDPSIAFIQCVAAGPWSSIRNKVVATHAVEKFSLKYSDLSQAKKFTVLLPTKNQNKIIHGVAKHCRDYVVTFRNSVEKLTEHEFNYLVRVVESSAPGSKFTGSVWFFGRDFLRLNVFPINSASRRFLLSNRLPDNQLEMMRLCASAKISAADFSRRIEGHIKKNK